MLWTLPAVKGSLCFSEDYSILWLGQNLLLSRLINTGVLSPLGLAFFFFKGCYELFCPTLIVHITLILWDKYSRVPLNSRDAL